MTSTPQRTPPPGTVPLEEFYARDARRQGSHVLSYGSGWQEADWTDHAHVIEILWFGATHEIVAFYITYDWSRLGPGQMTRDAVGAAVQDLSFDSGAGIGRLLGDLDLATSDVHVRVLGVAQTGLACHELLWDWRWLQHHRDGFDHVAARIRDHDDRSDGPAP